MDSSRPGAVFAVALVSTLLCWRPSPAPAAIDEAQFRRDVQAIAASGRSRVIGSEGYEKTAEYLRDEIRKLQSTAGAVEFREHAFPVMVPVTEQATLALP